MDKRSKRQWLFLQILQLKLIVSYAVNVTSILIVRAHDQTTTSTDRLGHT